MMNIERKRQRDEEKVGGKEKQRIRLTKRRVREKKKKEKRGKKKVGRNLLAILVTVVGGDSR